MEDGTFYWWKEPFKETLLHWPIFGVHIRGFWELSHLVGSLSAVSPLFSPFHFVHLLDLFAPIFGFNPRGFGILLLTPFRLSGVTYFFSFWQQVPPSGHLSALIPALGFVVCNSPITLVVPLFVGVPRHNFWATLASTRSGWTHAQGCFYRLERGAIWGYFQVRVPLSWALNLSVGFSFAPSGCRSPFWGGELARKRGPHNLGGPL